MKQSLARAVAILSATTALSGCILDDIPLGAGYAAKYMCSGLWVSNMEPDTLKNEYIAPQVQPLSSIWRVDVNESAQTVSVRDIFFGRTYEKTAYYRDGLGCTLVQDSDTLTLDDQVPADLFNVYEDPFAAWPHGDAEITNSGPNPTLVEQALDTAFAEDNEDVKNTLSVAVVLNGQLIAERYADGVDKTTRLLSWSMAKTLTAAAIGILDNDGLLNVSQPAPVAGWADDARAEITLEDMLQMASGISWNEASQGDDADQGFGLFQVEDMAAYYAEQPLESEPGTVFNYSTGQSNLLARIAQQAVGGSLEDYYRFINERLFLPIGINDAIVEFDTAGHPVGGAYHYLNTRDWARIGLLLQRKGNWFGEQVLPEAWVDAMIAPSTANESYGFQTWLNTNKTYWPELPESTYALRGFQGQTVMVIPEENLIIVRTGVTFGGDSVAGIEPLAKALISAVQPY
ncbi:MAG: serine hydrolase [Thalassolituus sp.]